MALLNSPTAQTSLVEMAVTPLRTLRNALGLGLETTLHCVPFQCSVSVCVAPPETVISPTAQTSLAATTATEMSSLPVTPGLGLEITFQAAAFATPVARIREMNTATTTHESRLTFKCFMTLLTTSCSLKNRLLNKYQGLDLAPLA